MLIFLHDKNWYQPSSLPVIYDDEEEEEEEKEVSASQTIHSQESQNGATFPMPSIHSVGATIAAEQTVASGKPEYEFLIFNYLLRFVHREGNIGDLARGGILSLVTIAMYSGNNNSSGESQNATISVVGTDGISTDPVAEASLAFAEYILDGDFPQVLCAGIGAVYGMVESTDPDFLCLLHHFLHLLEFMQDLLVQITLVVSSSDPGAESTPASSLVGLNLSDTILDTFRTTFLRNVLYPSILECSDEDGSAVAVMAYIDEMLRVTRSERSISDLIIIFLMSRDDNGEEYLRSSKILRTENERRTRKKKHRKSTALVLLEHHHEQRLTSQQQYDILTMSLGRFTLKDLLIDNIRSTHPHSTSAALRLLRSLCTDHCHITSTVDGPGLFTVDWLGDTAILPLARLAASRNAGGTTTEGVNKADYQEEFVYPREIPGTLFSPKQETIATSSDYAREVELYEHLVSRIVPAGSEMPASFFETSASSSRITPCSPYGNYLNDAVTLISHTSCFTLATSSAVGSSHVHQPSLSQPHRLSPTDALIQTVLHSLRLFFINTPQLNVELTGVLSSICACPYRDMRGWLGLGANEEAWDVEWEGKESSKKQEDSDEDEDGDDKSIDFKIDVLLRSSIKPSSKSRTRAVLPVLYSVLSGLVAQLERYRRVVTNLDKFLEERRQGLLFFADNITDAINLNMEMVADAQALGRGAKHQDGKSTGSLVPAPPPNTPAKPNVLAKGLASFTGIFSPKSGKSSTVKLASPSKSNSSTVMPQTPLNPARKTRDVPTSPFAPHYKHTKAITIEGSVAPAPVDGPWSPHPRPLKSTMNAPVHNPFALPSHSPFDSRDETSIEDVFTASAPRLHEMDDDKASAAPLDLEQALARRASAARLNLSQLLDNVVILEEWIKELSAILQVRKSLGIDALAYS